MTTKHNFKGATSGKLRTSVEWKGKRYLLPFNGAKLWGRKLRPIGDGSESI